MTRRATVPRAWLWGLSLVAAWVMIAIALHQNVLAQQPSQALVAFGAFKGRSLTVDNAWRLVAAQWLHVNVAHMLLNAAVIAIVGAAVERRTSAGSMMLVGLLGGTAGTLASAFADPGGFVSGASQAYLSLCGAAMVMLRRGGAAWWLAIAATAVAIGLDVRSAGTIKAGHLAGFVVGMVAGAVLMPRRRRPAR